MADRMSSPGFMLRRYGAYLRPQRRAVLGAVSASLLAAALAALTPLPVKFIIDNLLTGKGVPLHLPVALSTAELVLLMAGAAALLAALSAIFAAHEKIVSARIRERMTLDLRLACLDRLTALTPLCRGDDRSGELGLRLVDDVQQVARLFTKTLPVILRHGLTLLFTLAALVWIAPLLGLASAVIAILLGAMIRLAARPLWQTAKAKRTQEGRIAALTQEILRALSFIQASGAEGSIRKRFEAVNRSALGAGIAETHATVRLERAMQIANGLAVAVVVGGGGWLALEGTVSAGDLAIAIIYLNQMLRPIEKINELSAAVVGATSRGARLAELLDRDERLSRTGTFCLPRAEGTIELSMPSFSYANGRDFEFDSITIPARFLVTIEGPSGAGKSTLLALLTRLFDPLKGSICLDGRAYTDWALASLRSQFAICPQSPPLMSGTVRDWLLLGNVTADDNAQWHALRSVSMAEVVRARGGLDMQLGEAGAGLSGGEQARLALARALVSDRPVMLLDEPFANADPVSANVMLKALMAERGRRTIIIVTHQPLPGDCTDMRLCLEHGRLHRLDDLRTRKPA